MALKFNLKKPLSERTQNILNKVTKFIWIIFLIGVISIPLYFYSVYADFLGLYGGLPSFSQLENPESDLSSELYSSDNVLLGKYYRKNRTKVEYKNLSPDLINALIATEDHRFNNHSGIDPIGLARVAVFSILLGQDAGGGSTISQQLAKNLFDTRSKYEGALTKIPYLRMLIFKTKEWIVSVQLESSYTKKEIISMYLNTVHFGSNAYGIKVAAQTFFNKHPSQLNAQESAVLVGLLKATSLYSPVSNPEKSLERRNTVLSLMESHGYLTEKQYDSISSLPIGLEYKMENHNEGMAPYFRTIVRNKLVKWAREHGYDLFEDGLKIYTTIDSRMQKHAETVVKNHMSGLQEKFLEHWEDRNPWVNEDGKEIKGFIEEMAKETDHYQQLKRKYGENSDSIEIIMNRPKKMNVFTWGGEKDTVLSPMDSIRHYQRFLHTGFMSMDPHNGNIKAWVGGINHKYFKYDHVIQGKRQPGSAFKPIVYAAAIDNGYSPCYKVVDAPVTFTVMDDGEETTWTPSNASNYYSGEEFTLREAMARSKNSITSFVMKRMGPSTVVDYAHKLGIRSHLSAVPSLSLGTEDVSLYELVGAYSTFANDGMWTEPTFIKRIEDKYGNVLQKFPSKTQEALSEEAAYIMLHMLRGSTEIPGGTAMGLDRSLRSNNHIGAKTGTTQNNSDGWFIGVTADLVSGAWVGGDKRSIRFRTTDLGQGARTAMPIWEAYMKKVYNDDRLSYEKSEFQKPSKSISVELDCSEYHNEVGNDTTNVDSIQIDESEQPDPNEIF